MRGSSRPIQVFLADPSTGVQSQVGDWSARYPLEVKTFANGRQLLRRAESERPDLILCDLALPAIDGLTALRLLKGQPVPVVMLTVDSLDGAHGALEALICGAADYLVKRDARGGERIAVTPGEFMRRMSAWRPMSDVARERAPARWCEWDPREGDAAARFVARPFPAGSPWIGLALAATRSIRSLVRAFAVSPRQMAGPMLVRVHQAESFEHALRDALMRHCDRAVPDFLDGEELRPGQWRLLPGRLLLAGRDPRRNPAWRCIANRAAEPRNSLRRQIAQLESLTHDQLRIYLFERPDPASIPPLTRLVARGHVVLLHESARPPAQIPPERIAARECEPSGMAGRPR